MNINYEYYRIFYYVGKYKNLTQAAEVLHNNQPNISRTIKLLEHEMGCKLLIRSNRGISLTPEGERLYAYVKTAVEQIQSAEEEITKSVNMQAGSVTIGASETALRMLVLPVLSIFKKHYPDIRIRILNHLTTQAIESVKKGMVDFAVVATPAMIEKPLISYPIWKLKDIVIGGTSYEKLSNRILTIEELAAYPLICLGETTMTYQLYDEFYHKHNLVLKPELEAATTDQILPMVKNDLGVAYIPEIFAKEALENKEVYRLHLAEEIPERQLCFVENQRFPLSIAAKELKALILDYTK